MQRCVPGSSFSYLDQTLDKDNHSKYNMQVLNHDFIHYGNKRIQTCLPCVQK